MTSPRPIPVIVKDRPDMPLPEDVPIFYLLCADGLYLCRNHPFFRSCVPAPMPPGHLAAHPSSLQVGFPRVPRRMMELVVGFFSEIAERHDAEAGALLAFDRRRQKVRLIVPEQTATVGTLWRGRGYPVGLHYQIPADVPREYVMFGDIHSHADAAAFSSATDVHDEEHRTGLHIVVGRIRNEPPDFHAEAVVDGSRFVVEQELVMEGYERRATQVPERWLQRVKVEPAPPVYGSWGGSGWGTARGAGQGRGQGPASGGWDGRIMPPDRWGGRGGRINGSAGP